MRTTLISLLTAVMTISCQQESLEVVVTEEYDDMEAITFHVDTITFGDSIRVKADFKRSLSNDARMTFVNVDGREKIVEHILNPGHNLSDSVVMEPYSLAAGKHSVSFFASTGYKNRKEDIEFFDTNLKDTCRNIVSELVDCNQERQTHKKLKNLN